MTAPPIAISLTPADRAALERLARGESRAAFRARAVLALADGDCVAEAARSLRLTEKTVRAARARFLSEGVDGLRARSAGCEPCVPRFDAGVPAALKRYREPGRSGPAPLARLKVECWVRGCAARGLLRPGARLPERSWFIGHFRVSAHAVQSAFDSLAAQGFVRSVPRGASFLARAFPFSGRFLLVLEAKQGLCLNLERAARETERIRPGVSWTVVWRSRKTPAAEIAEVARDLAMQRYCGAFMRFAHAAEWLPGPAMLASVPDVPIAVDKIHRGTVVSPLVRALDFSRMETWDEAFAAFRRAGRRRFFVIDASPEPDERDREAEVRAAAASAGVSIPPFGYLAPVGGNGDKNLRRIFGMALALTAPDAVDAILVRRDDFLKSLSASLRARWGGAAAARIPVICWSAGRLLPDEGLNVEWRGCDLVATMLSFIDWSEAVRAGDPHPPEPRAVR